MPVETIRCLATRLGQGKLSLVFDLTGDLDRLHLPDGEPIREDGLWRHTCFEAFVRPTGGTGYFEFNFAPNGSWAAYQFSGYRAAMGNADLSQPIVRHVRAGDNFGLAVGIDLGGLTELVPWEDWEIGLSAVVEATERRLSYWALRHPPEGPPDFHHPDCFALTLPAPGGA